MKYHSTRSLDEVKTFEEVLTSTYADDGGLYVPDKVPLLSSEQLKSMIEYPFPDVCAEIMHLYTSIELDSLKIMAAKAFSEFNGGIDPLPITKVGDMFLLDTSLGPTFAFKDIGQQMVAQIMNFVMTKRRRKVRIVVETSGDTGPAAIAGVKGCEGIDIFCLYPKNRVSRVQELQMITAQEDNVHVFRTEGDTDDQASVLKELFSDKEYVQRHNICSVNSINWARIAAQSSYYVWSYLHLCNQRVITFGEEVQYVVPTGACGNCMGGFLAKRMGVPIRRLICATNANDVVHRAISTGDMSMQPNQQTVSPAMDIQTAYNLERILYYVCNENTAAVNEIMKKAEMHNQQHHPAATGLLDKVVVSRIQEIFSSYSVSDEQTLSTIASVYWETQTITTTARSGGSSKSSSSSSVSIPDASAIIDTIDTTRSGGRESITSNISTGTTTSSGIQDGKQVLLCPHSATAVYVARKELKESQQEPLSKIAKTKTICVLTAHPAKFEETIHRAMSSSSSSSSSSSTTTTTTRAGPNSSSRAEATGRGGGIFQMPALPAALRALEHLPLRFKTMKKPAICSSASSASSSPDCCTSRCTSPSATAVGDGTSVLVQDSLQKEEGKNAAAASAWRAEWIQQLKTEIEATYM